MTRQQLDTFLRNAVILGALAVLLVPAARANSQWFGWLPLWLLGMPLVAWWSLRGWPVPRMALRLPRRRQAQATRRGLRPQARSRGSLRNELSAR
jgi:hypothetical protein